MISHLKKAYFTDKNYSYLYLHSIFKSAAFLTMFLFIGGWLYEMGIPLHWIVMYHAANFTLMGLCSPLSAFVTQKLGAKATFGLSYVLFMGNMICLSYIDFSVGFLALGVLFAGLANGLQNPLDIIFQAIYVQDQNRGKVMSFVNALGSIISVAAVIFSGWILDVYGFLGIAATCSIFWGICWVFLYLMDPIKQQITEQKGMESFSSIIDLKNRNYLYIAFGFQFIVIASIVLIPILMYLATDSFAGMSYIAAMAIVVQTIVILMQGLWVDKAKNNHPLLVALGINSAGLLTYAFAAGLSKYALLVGDVLQRTGFLLFMGTLFPRVHSDITRDRRKLLDFGVTFHMQICLWEALTLPLLALIVFFFGADGIKYNLLLCVIGAFLCYIRLHKMKNVT